MSITDLYPKNRHAIIKYSSICLKKDPVTITYNDVELFKQWITDQLHQENNSPNTIAKNLGITHTNFGMFITNCLNIQLKNIGDAVSNYMHTIGRAITDEKKKYWTNCKFVFDPFRYPQIIGFDLLFQYKFYHATKNPNGLNRDHMISIDYGWINGIDSKIISHPANCQIMLAHDNFKKNNSCSIELGQLLERIQMWDHQERLRSLVFIQKNISKPKSPEHRAKLADRSRNHRIYTNGIGNIKQDKDLPIPVGYRPGMTRKKIGSR